MILYHGGIEKVEKSEIRIPNRGLDFGTGFYTTTNIGQARAHARRGVIRAKVQGKKLKVSELYDQVVFRTAKSINQLRFTGSHVIEDFETKTHLSSRLYPIIQELISEISKRYTLNEIAATEQLYSSKFYDQLEVEETGIWYLSISALMDIFDEEKQTGKLVLEDL
jgi:hypothetical protein